jgi:FtsP/CotA-like multicopper oxidase with cupredoxin domain
MNGVDRRSVLLAALGAAGTGTLGAAPAAGPRDAGPPAPTPRSAVAAAAAPAAAAATAPEQRIQLTAEPATVDLGAGITARTWAFGGRLPGREVRLTAGETLVADLTSRLPDGAGTAVHWHGLAVPYAMDGAPPVTQAEVPPGGAFTYRFTARTPGTYFYHPHVGVQPDRAMYGALVVADPREPLAYDDEWVLVLDDWLDGVTGTPDEVLDELEKGTYREEGGQADSPLLASPGGSVAYPYHLVNGRVPADPDVYAGRPGSRVRLRIVNAGSDTAYRVALGGHRMTVTHSDGYPVEHMDTDAVLVGMGERYDALVTLQGGVFPLVALAEGKSGSAFALVRTGQGAAPAPDVRPAELDGAVLTVGDLTSAPEVRLPPAPADIAYEVRLTGSMGAYDWAVNGRRFDMAHPADGAFQVRQGQRVRLDFVNHTAMWHPMHLHGHTYQLGDTGPRKDTVAVLPHRTVSVQLDADNPGDWFLHCHNVYHGEAGMMALLSYVTD